MAEEKQVTFELVEELDGETVNQAEFGDPVTGDRVELKAGEKFSVPEKLAVELDSIPFLERSASQPKKSAAKKADEEE